MTEAQYTIIEDCFHHIRGKSSLPNRISHLHCRVLLQRKEVKRQENVRTGDYYQLCLVKY